MEFGEIKTMAYVVILSSAVYFLPFGIAIIRERSNKLAIFLLNLFLGWTLIGWVVALVWAATSDAATSTSTPTPAPAGNPSSSLSDEIVKLGELRDSGVLTGEEFEEAKRKLISG